MLLAQLYKIANTHLACPPLQLLYRSGFKSKERLHLHLRISKASKGPPTILRLYLSNQVLSIIIAMSSHESQAEKVHQDREIARQKGMSSFFPLKNISLKNRRAFRHMRRSGDSKCCRAARP